MTPSSGQIRLAGDIGQSSLGSSYAGFLTTNVAISNYYLGGTYIPNVSGLGSNTSVPTSGQISFSQLWNVYGYKRLSFNITFGSSSYASGKSTYSVSGYSLAAASNPFNVAGAYGSISSSSFTTFRGAYQIVGLYYDQQNGSRIILALKGPSAPQDTDLDYIAFYEAYHGVVFARSARNATYTSGTVRTWWTNPTYTFPSSGTYGGYLNYYG